MQDEFSITPLGAGSQAQTQKILVPRLKPNAKFNSVVKKDNPYHDKSMFKGAPHSAFLKARLLRKKMTASEKILWSYLQNKKFEGYKFRRQHPLHLFIVDFYCHELGLIIEVDGAYHEVNAQKEQDEKRTELLKFQGLTVIRFTNEEVGTDIDIVLTKIKEAINKINSS